eukprot:1016138-Amphidinium_carterae.1
MRRGRRKFGTHSAPLPSLEQGKKGSLLLAPGPLLPAREPALIPKPGVTTVWTDGSGKHSNNPHFRRCGVGYVTDTGER